MGAVKEKLITILESGNWRGIQDFYSEGECSEEDAKRIFYFWAMVFKGKLAPGYSYRNGKIIKVKDGSDI